jgi:deazaflavin-dependent oxidoreductase (nitroreductase family)
LNADHFCKTIVTMDIGQHKPGNRQYNLLQRFVQKFASTRPGAWFGAHAMHHFDRAFFKLSGGRATLTSYIGGLPMVMLTTNGAKSGLPRATPLVAIQDETNPRRLALIASNWGQDHHPGWYHNLKANPLAHCAIDGVSSTYLAHEASGEEYTRFWQKATQTYLGYPLYRQRVGERRIPIMVLEAVEAPKA